MTGVPAWWRSRTPRERRLLLAMLVLLVAVAAWLLVVRPLSDALDSAMRRHNAAVTAVAEARARAEAARRMRAEPVASAPLPLDSFLARTAAEAGFTDARVAAGGPIRATVAIEAARPQAFFGWVQQLERNGVTVETLSARANADRTLTVEAAFHARRG